MKRITVSTLLAAGMAAMALTACGSDEPEKNSVAWWEQQDTDKIEAYIKRCEQDENAPGAKADACQNAIKAAINKKSDS